MSRGEADVAPFWPDVEEWDGYVDEVALLWTDEPIDTFVCASELDDPDSLCDEDSPPQTGSDEQQCCMSNSVVCPTVLYVQQCCMSNSVVCPTVLYVQQCCMSNSVVCPTVLYVQQCCMSNSVVCPTVLYVQQCCMFNSVVCSTVLCVLGPPGPGDEDSDIWEKAVPLRRTSSDQIVTNVVSTVGPGGPCDEDSLPQTGFDEPAPGVTPCWTSLEEGDTYGDDDVLPRTGSHEPVSGVTP